MPTAREILSGDARAAARLMRDLDDGLPSAMRTLKSLYRHTGRAHIVGITGAPGVGKSTIAGRLVAVLRGREKTVGVVAVDPTSPVTGGALLGDRVRMQEHANDPEVFIRSLATRGRLGGLSRSTLGIVHVMDAMGKDVILVETVGAGQDAVEIARVAHTNIVVVAPGLGDDVQAMKAGILEIADIFAVNKSDRDGADRVRREIEAMIAMGGHAEGSWIPPVVSTVASEGTGISLLWEEAERHRAHLCGDGDPVGLRRERVREELVELLKCRLAEKAMEELERRGMLEPLLAAMAGGKTDPYSAAGKIAGELIGARRKGSGARKARSRGEGRR
ncbi:MAG: methylmalonyl Co-A mutase-associated GTPase MeaB [Thermodesulfobacteriota bacterium]